MLPPFCTSTTASVGEPRPGCPPTALGPSAPWHPPTKVASRSKQEATDWQRPAGEWQPLAVGDALIRAVVACAGRPYCSPCSDVPAPQAVQPVRQCHWLGPPGGLNIYTFSSKGTGTGTHEALLLCCSAASPCCLSLPARRSSFSPHRVLPTPCALPLPEMTLLRSMPPRPAGVRGRD